MTKLNFAEGLAKAAFENSEDLYSILDALPMNIVFCGPDLNIKYLNPSSIELLNKNQKLLPVPINEVLEASADIFLNKTNNHQSILANPRQQLPLNSNINFGEEIVKLSMIPIYSGDEFRGALISWSIITDKLKLDNELHTANSIVKSLSKSQAMIEFSPDGTVVYANDNFLNVLGYKLGEIKGRHHSIFCDPSFSSSSSYRDFWARLNRGEIDSGQHKRISKSGQDVWIQATYNPIFDNNGKVVKVVKFATDINHQKHEALNLIKSLSDAERKLTIAAQDLTATATQLSSNSAKTTTQSESASASAEQVSQGVRNVATNTEEMTASIKEISRSTAEAARMSRESQVKARETNNIIQKLGTSSSEIGTVVKVISSIAQQTNLLALNATIEAARAGDAGKGFAVVANEVKELAKQTAKATEEISSKIGAIQKDSEVAVSAMGDIAKAIEQLNNISVSISTAIEEQTANTNEVTRIVSESSLAVKDVAVSIKEVSMMSQLSSSGASLSLDAAKNLSILATELSGLVKRVETSF